MIEINYHNKLFRSKSNTPNGEVDGQTIFKYTQDDNLITGTYSGGQIISGQLIAIVNENGTLDMRYQHINNDQEFRTGICTSTPKVLENGKIILHEKWQWTSGDKSQGESIIEEI